MPSQPAIPPLLSSHLPTLPPQGSLTLITSVLRASANWIILRQLWVADKAGSSASNEDATNVKVVLVSWLRGLDFWRDSARRLGLKFVGEDEKFTFIDALQSGLGLQEGGIRDMAKQLLKIVEEGQSAGMRILLILDGIDCILAATECKVNELLDIIWEFLEVSMLKITLKNVHALSISVSADYPLIQVQDTPLELNHAAFVIGVAHQARVIWGVRELDTGSARDVTGVLRITRGPSIEKEEDTEKLEVEEKELLYFVAGDGGVRVFEKGSS
ncbi:MAG: hypothetical protein Q9219_003060 [cf. Caloplaca sp. 3 TL-2023]